MKLTKNATITSLELLGQINTFRREEGKRTELRHDTLRNVIKDEFEEEILSQNILEKSISSNGGRPTKVFILTLNQSKQILVRESKFVRKAVIHYIEQLENQIKKTQITSDKNKRLEIMEKNANVRMAKMLKSLIPYSKSERYKEILVSEATKVLTGKELIPPPKVAQRTLTATEIAEKLGTNRNKIGKIANKYNLKNEYNGYWVHEKASHCNKEIPNFRYFEKMVEEFKKYL